MSPPLQRLKRHRHDVVPRPVFDRPVLEAARDLLGMILVRLLSAASSGEPVRLAGRIVEVEAYDGQGDLACHASKGRTPRTDPMFGEAGHAYIYLVYGMHSCLNVVTGPPGYPAAVLLRAVEPLQGGEAMHRPDRRQSIETVASGPGRLTRAFHIDRALNRIDLCRPGELFLEHGEPVADRLVRRGPRIGVDYAGAWARKPWRFGVTGSPSLSRPFGR